MRSKFLTWRRFGVYRDNSIAIFKNNSSVRRIIAWARRVHKNSQLWVVKLEHQWILTFILFLLITPRWRFCWHSHNKSCLCLWWRVITEAQVGDLSPFNYLSICKVPVTSALHQAVSRTVELYEDGARLIILLLHGCNILKWFRTDYILCAGKVNQTWAEDWKINGHKLEYL